ncbi:hypothetical protein [Pseudomonas sp. NMI4491_12]|uniref:hypothetical protein n=1 Tax=Pseudomonas sp. NMI4491_12 TaxID=2903146 RepID=UPI001E5D08FC|nr:hypothetical protein [Pseudomonas sp. NMI4491_12]MCE0965632.1 hypothetical protein [Pseudomonas sp. NMI4491_12]
MSLTKQEVSRGAVAILDGDALLKDPLIANGDHGYVGMRPFVCLSTNGDESVWMLLTTVHSEKRLLLDQWKVPGSEKWMSEPQYLNDARKSFSGPTDSFIASSKREFPHYPHQRPSISEEGMLAIEREMAKYSRKR